MVKKLNTRAPLATTRPARLGLPVRLHEIYRLAVQFLPSSMIRADPVLITWWKKYAFAPPSWELKKCIYSPQTDHRRTLPWITKIHHSFKLLQWPRLELVCHMRQTEICTSNSDTSNSSNFLNLSLVKRSLVLVWRKMELKFDWKNCKTGDLDNRIWLKLTVNSAETTIRFEWKKLKLKFDPKDSKI